jgi:DNA repair exonuclease SbcCD ATPase subunit
MPMPLQDVQDLPDFIDSHYKEVTKEIIGLKNKLQEIEAIEKYYERNFLFELRTNTQQKKKEIQQKLNNTLANEILDCNEKVKLHSENYDKIKDCLNTVYELYYLLTHSSVFD